MDTRLVFMGTPDFSVPALKALIKNFRVVGIITQPDRPAGRGRQLVPSAIKSAGLDYDLEIFQPLDTNTDKSLDQIRTWKPDLICVVAFGQILSPDLLAIPPHGCLNLHASLLPRWRGASPINAAILAGDQQTGVTIMKMAQGLDNGPILRQTIIDISDDESAGSLSERLALMGADLLVETIPDYLQGNIDLQPQDPLLVTYAGLLKKSDGKLDFAQAADELARKVRAFSPWPGTFTFWNDNRLIVHSVRAVSVTSPGGGVLLIHEDEPAIGTADGILVLEDLQLAGRKKVSGSEFLRGNPNWE